jgi:hypothetical protein
LYNVHITSKFLHKVVKMISDKVSIHLPRWSNAVFILFLVCLGI